MTILSRPRSNRFRSAIVPMGARLLALSAIGIVMAGAVCGDEERDQWQPYFKQVAGEYRIAPQSEPDREFSLHDTPVLRWSQPVRGGDDGAVFVWLNEGRPAVIGTVFCWPAGDGRRVVTNEFHSLSTEPLVAKRSGAVAWSPPAGIEFQEFREAPDPAASENLRLVQMRRLAERFRGENYDDFEKQKWELRLLSQPLFRYKPRAAGGAASENAVVDGALFTLASGTDPEILVLIEAKSTPQGPRWNWALARFSDRPLTAWLDDEQVWTVERAQTNESTPHFIVQIDRLAAPPAVQAPSEPASKTP